MDCDHLEPLIEAIADGTIDPSAGQRAHLASCRVCTARIERARAIEQLLAMREVLPPPSAFTVSVMANVGREKWQTERVIDLGFNLAVLAGVLIVLAGGVGLAWSLGLLTVTIDLDALLQVVDSAVAGRIRSQLQTILMAAGVLAMALGLWWWAETESEF